MKRGIIMQTETLNVTGMTCEGCTSKVAHALNAITGVHEVVVSLATSEAAVRYDEHLTATDQLKSAVKSAGYGVNSTHAAHAPQSKGGCCG
jgi:copper chaperone